MPAQARAIACPFCGLVCDDLSLGASGIDTRDCPKAAAGFARRHDHTEHRVAGRAVSLDEAAAAAARLLREARLPLITGLSTDVAGVRALLALADRVGAVIDRWGSTVQMRNLAVAQESGAWTATFGEVANRADVILLLGRDPARAFPRFFERLVGNRNALYRAGPPWVAFAGAADAAPEERAVAERLHLDPGRWLDWVSALALALRGQAPRTPEVAGMPVAAIAALAERLESARYGALVWDAAAFAEDGDLVIAMVLRVLRLLNRRTRWVGLPMGGDDNAQGVQQAMLWQAGWPARLSFAAGVPEHDPWQYDAERLLAAGAADALLWVAALSPAPPPGSAVPTVALVAPDVRLAAEPAVTIRVGVPGLDHAGAVMRADTVVALPLAATRPSSLPSVATAAGAILDKLGDAAP